MQLDYSPDNLQLKLYPCWDKNLVTKFWSDWGLSGALTFFVQRIYSKVAAASKSHCTKPHSSAPPPSHSPSESLLPLPLPYICSDKKHMLLFFPEHLACLLGPTIFVNPVCIFCPIRLFYLHIINWNDQFFWGETLKVIVSTSRDGFCDSVYEPGLF